MELVVLLDRARAFFDHPRYVVMAAAIERKRPLFRPLFHIVHRLGRYRSGNMLLLIVVLLLYRPLRIPAPNSCALFQYGPSVNNERVFRRINTAAGLEDRNAVINGIRPPLWLRLRCICAGGIRSVAWALARQSSSHGLAHAQLVLAGAAKILFRVHGLGGVRLACVGSDHSPVSMSLLHEAQERGIARCYLQHAPVSDYFPPLDYELSILFDRASLGIYDRAAAARGRVTQGQVIILPPFESDHRHVDVADPPWRIGLCLSYLYRHEAVHSLLDVLDAEPTVESVLVRRHPRCRSPFDRPPGGKARQCPAMPIESFLDQCDIVLVPNSGVAIEALHHGRPTFHLTGTDDVADDYYGFVASGVVPRFDRATLRSRDTVLAAFRADEWGDRFARYDATSSESLATLRASAGRRFKALIDGDGQLA